MRKSLSGNFLLQALLAIALIMAFMPFLASRMAVQKNDAAAAAIARQVNIAARAARGYLTENEKNINYGITKTDGDDFVDLLEPFGLPLGFIPTTIDEQKISLVAIKSQNDMTMLVALDAGNLSESARAALMTRIGPDAAELSNDGVLSGIGGWEKKLGKVASSLDTDAIYVYVQTGNDYSELVRRNSSDIKRNRFHTDLYMGDNMIRNMTSLSAKNADIGIANFGTLNISGTSDKRNIKNKIESLNAGRAVFQTRDGANALNITGGNLIADSITTGSLFMYGGIGDVSAGDVSLNSLTMSVGKTGFNSTGDWRINGNMTLSNISLDTQLLEIKGFINAARGQDVFIDTDELTYSTTSGIIANSVSTSFITLRDQISSSLLSGGTGAVILDIRPAGVSLLPDILLSTINNDDFSILRRPLESNADTDGCSAIIRALNKSPKYNEKSVSQNVVCQMVYLHRLEQRLNAAECIAKGRSDCGV
ncbi:MAG: hypothetical protein LBL75_00860 [Rickettsiales bacterium]|nr:hypothetical protein [Rickettsiales bacterium]